MVNYDTIDITSRAHLHACWSNSLLIIVAVVQEDLLKLVSIVRVIFRELQEEIFQEFLVLIRWVKELSKSGRVEVHVGVKVQNISQRLHVRVVRIHRKSNCGQRREKKQH